MIRHNQRPSRTLATSICASITLFAIGNEARAELIQFSNSGFGANSALIQSFDTSLGTLDSVDVNISGMITLDLLTTQNLVVAGDTVVPVPYVITGQLFETFQGSAFNSMPPGGVYSVSGIADGTGAPTTAFVPINDSFHFDATTDLVGFAAGSDGTSLFSGTRSNFAIGPFSVPLIEVSVPNFIDESSPLATMFNSDIAGAILVQYNYTPTPPEPPTSVPEPNDLALLGIGLALVALRRRKASAL